MLQGNDILKVLNGVPHILNSPASTKSTRNTYVLHEHTHVEPLVVFKLMESSCVRAHVLPIGTHLYSLQHPTLSNLPATKTTNATAVL
jgi:hypothetical protein